MSGEPDTLHERIVADVTRNVVEGRWPPGHRIPFETEMAAAYGCSRMTVNKALSQLARSGLIERRKRSGSFVAHQRAQSAILEIHDLRSEVESVGLDYAFRLLSRRTARAVDTTLGGSGAAVLVDTLHLAGGRPFCLEERAIAVASVPQVEDETFAQVPPGAWLLTHVPWSNAEHTIRAVEADRATARHLGLRTGGACLAIDRRTWSGETPVTVVRLTYPAALHAVTARFAPEGR